MTSVTVDGQLVEGALRRLAGKALPPMQFKVSGPDGAVVFGRVLRGWGMADVDVRFSGKARRSIPMALPVTVLFLDALGNLRGATLGEGGWAAPSS